LHPLLKRLHSQSRDKHYVLNEPSFFNDTTRCLHDWLASVTEPTAARTV
jgi:hypothetical protein